MDRSRIRALFAAVVLYFVSLYVYVPNLPAFVAERTSTLTAVGVVLSMYGLWMAILRMPLGIVADVTGRHKPYLVVGMLLAAVGPLVMAAGRSIGVLALGRAITGAAAAAWVPMVVVFASFYSPEQAIFATSLLTFAASFGQMIGAGLAGVLETFGGYGLVFLAASGLAVAACLVIIFMKIPRSDPAHRSRVTVRSILAVYGRRDVLVPSLANALCQFAIWALVFGFMPILARRMGADAVRTGLLMTLNIAANTVANLGATLLANRGGGRFILFASFAIFAAGALLASLAGSVALLFVATGIMGFASGFGVPILVGLSIQNVDASHRTTAMGFHQTVYSIGLFTGPWIGGIIADAVGIRGMFAIVAVFSVAAPSIVISLNRFRRADTLTRTQAR